MLERIKEFAKNRKTNYSETILWYALKYALRMDEGEAVEAVITTMKPMVPTFSDRMLRDSLTAVESYIQEVTMITTGEQFFLPEWCDVRAWLLAEKERRESREKDEG